ncbi:uncharacterized protein LOC119295716 [Triticum dicoccoides]|uniref:uncharacterized protein LOC119295716 n=1 Tax=Triticum dicoccoides TaxID=85692 RepID=UPI000E7B64A6|nr:uncharacterized protein LOC119295716 [Triticum dicoccoides]
MAAYMEGVEIKFKNLQLCEAEKKGIRIGRKQACSSQVKQNEKMQKQQQDGRWSRPPPGTLKINTDGAFLKETNTGGWGFVIRDDCGEVMAAGAGNLERVSDALHS